MLQAPHCLSHGRGMLPAATETSFQSADKLFLNSSAALHEAAEPPYSRNEPGNRPNLLLLFRSLGGSFPARVCDRGFGSSWACNRWATAVCGPHHAKLASSHRLPMGTTRRCLNCLSLPFSPRSSATSCFLLMELRSLPPGVHEWLQAR